MKTTKEMIEVMAAFDEGKEIEWRFAIYDNNWADVTTPPEWNWGMYDYRVKPGKKFRPYKDTEEMLDDFCERFHVKRTDFGEPFIWIQSKISFVKYLVEVITDSSVCTLKISIGMTDLFKKYTYKDGSPCGKEIKE